MRTFALVTMFVSLWLILIHSDVRSQTCTKGTVDITLIPSAPLQFQFFPMGLMGIGGTGNVGVLTGTGFERFGLQLQNTAGAQQQLNIAVYLYQGGASIGSGEAVFSDEMTVTVFVPPGGPYFISVPQLINNNITGLRSAAHRPATISRTFRNALSGGVPSGNFRFDIVIDPVQDPNIGDAADHCGSFFVEILTGATVDLIVPGNGGQAGPLPLFQWAAIGGNKFQLAIAKVRAGQSYEDALRTSSQRVLLDINGTNTFQATAGGPISGGNVTTLENNLTWNPGLLEGEYCYRVTMIQEEPLTGSQNFVTSAINSFTVSNTAMMIGVGGGINTDEILNLLRSLSAGEAIVNELRGYSAISIEINGTAATVTDLRTKLGELPEVYKVEIKP
jgi:hypothetical protein